MSAPSRPTRGLPSARPAHVKVTKRTHLPEWQSIVRVGRKKTSTNPGRRRRSAIRANQPTEAGTPPKRRRTNPSGPRRSRPRSARIDKDGENSPLRSTRRRSGHNGISHALAPVNGRSTWVMACNRLDSNCAGCSRDNESFDSPQEAESQGGREESEGRIRATRRAASSLPPKMRVGRPLGCWRGATGGQTDHPRRGRARRGSCDPDARPLPPTSRTGESTCRSRST